MTETIGKRLIITGACGALGQVVVNAGQAKGHRIATIDRVTTDAFSPCVRQIPCDDLFQPNPGIRSNRYGHASLGGVDALINLAGAFEWTRVEDASPAIWGDLFEANVGTASNAIHAVLPHLSEAGSILCVGAASADPAGAGMGPYAAAKSGVARLVQALSAELAPRRIRVNAVLPAIIDTPRNRRDMPDADPALWTSPAAIADVILFLLSVQARAINGALVPVTNAVTD